MRLAELLLSVGALLVAAPAGADLFRAGDFSAYGDFRLRLESDRDSQSASGAQREDRTRMRVRLRAGFRFEPNDHLLAEVRLRTGPEESQQSPHVTILDFDGNDTGEASLVFDRWYVRGRAGAFEAWAGRNSLPFWKQNELLFDDDATMPGVAVQWEADPDAGKLSVVSGYFSPPAGMKLFSGTLAAAQVVYQPEVAGVRLTFAGGGYRFDAEPDDPDGALLLQGNGSRDYSIMAGSVQARWDVGEHPLVVGFDLMRNSEDYDPNSSDPVTAANFDQTDGYVLLATYGGLAERHDWLVGYYYAHIETFAVHNSYSQDDWVRWGSASQTRGSDMKGHELRFGWAFDARVHVLARLYVVDSITSVEDGTRLRVDLNVSF